MGVELEPAETGGQSENSTDRWGLIRDIVVLQFKLIVDGLRDLILVPASLVVGIVSLFTVDDSGRGAAFYRLIALGKRSEQWIDLFGALRNAPPEIRQAGWEDRSIDDIVGRVETFVVDEYHRGGITAQAKEHIDKALDAIQDRANRERRAQDEDPTSWR